MKRNLIAIAEKIPAEYRKEIIELNLVSSAVAIAGNEPMRQLAVIWKNYIEHDFSGDCPLCYGRVLKNFQNLLPTLLEMQKDSDLLGEV